MDLINKVKTLALSSLAVGSGGALYGYYSAPNSEISKEVPTQLTAEVEFKSSGSPYKDCVERSPTIPQDKRTSVCGWLYRR